MAGGPSPSSTSPSNLSNSPFPHGSFSSASSSPPKLHYPPNTMTADVFAASHPYMLTPLDENVDSLLSSSEADSSPESKGYPTVVLRGLPSNSDQTAVQNMLLFATGLVNCDMVKLGDDNTSSAVARFETLEAAKQARDSLNGKRNASNSATITAYLLQGSPGAIGSRRNTVDTAVSARQGAMNPSTGLANHANGRHSSRFNGTFEKMSPPNGTPGLGNGEFPVQNVFSPTSPVNASFPRNLGKSVINDEADDDDGLLQESIGYGTGGQPLHSAISPRTKNPSIPVTRFASLSLNTNNVNALSSPPMPYASPRSSATMQSPAAAAALSAMSPHAVSSNNLASNTAYPPFSSSHFSRPNYPPVNPADQNPPCNTLYVGNLPMDTSEDELKAVFSKQRGYKRLCFRTKQNGPMCFVEFEDVSFATKALNELYGHPLHNSVKGGIRLSFSKNPLGVRSGQSSMGSPSAVTPTAAMPGFGGAVAPPPGFGPPPGLATPVHANGNAGFGNSGFGMYPNAPFVPPNDMRPQPVAATSVSGNGFGNGYAAYMMGR